MTHSNIYGTGHCLFLLQKHQNERRGSNKQLMLELGKGILEKADEKVPEGQSTMNLIDAGN